MACPPPPPPLPPPVGQFQQPIVANYVETGIIIATAQNCGCSDEGRSIVQQCPGLETGSYVPLPSVESQSQTQTSEIETKKAIIAQSLEFDVEFMKNEMIYVASLEAQKLSQNDGGGGFEDAKVSAALIVSNFVQPILQVGPLCGLVALAMTAPHSNCPEVRVDKIFEEAKKRGFTKSGEMFSAQNMSALAKDLLGYKSTLLDSREDMSQFCIMKHLLEGSLSLLPYDADSNHGPAKRRGYSAHWALLHGIVLFLCSSELESLELEGDYQGDQEIPILFKNPSSFKDKPQTVVKILKLLTILPKERKHVVARQGKSKRIGLWNLADLVESNQNLQEINPKIVQKSEEFVTNPIETCLCNQVILLEQLPEQ